RGVESDPGQGRDGPHGAVRGELPPAHVPAQGEHARRHARRAEGPRADLVSVRDDLPAQIEAYHAHPAEALGDEARAVFDELLDALERGEARAAEPTPDGWRVNGWVKKGILLGFKLGRIVATEPAGPLSFLDKDTFLPRRFSVGDRVRVIPGGTAVRHGAHVAPGVIIVPPAYINVGAYVGANSLIDSHALVGSCAHGRDG